jgi:uncharacterized protein YukE
MALNIPSELAFVLNVLGFEWPQLDEDEIHRGAHIIRQFRDDIEGLMDQADSTVNERVSSAFTAQAANAHVAGWNDAREQNMGQLCEILDGAATGVDVFGHAVLALKLKVIAELVITAAQLAAAAAAAAATLGIGAAATPAIIFARKKVMDYVVGEAVAAVVVEVATLVIEPLSGVFVAVLDTLMESPVTSAAVGEVEEYLVDLEALDEASSDMDASADDQERLGQDFIAQIMGLQISTAG